VSKSKKQKRITRKPKKSLAPKKRPLPKPKGPQKISIDEVKYLKFRITKLNEEILKLQEQKLEADERVIAITKKNVALRKQLTMNDITRIYDECGIEAGDQVVQDGEGFAILRPAGGKAPKATPKIVKDDEGDSKGTDGKEEE
jgi:hypothetical protein